MKLTKIRLINWMYFHDSTVSLMGNTAIAGANASGKTSLIDALQYALTGSKGQSKFNSAQGDSKRTLESYVRGHVGDSNIEYLRPNIAESYVALEVSDGQNTNVFGVYVSFDPSNNSTKEHRFVIKNKTIDELEFKIENKVISISKFRELNKDNYQNLESIIRYQDYLSSLLGLSKGSNYFKLVVSAINRRPINSVNYFIKNFLLEENKINIEEAQKALLQISKLKHQLENNEEKYQNLKTIKKENETYELHFEQVNNILIEQNYLNYNYITEQIKLNLKRIESNDKIIESTSFKIKALKLEYQNQRKELRSLISNRVEKYPNIDSIESELNQLATDKTNYKKESLRYIELLNEAKNILEGLNDFDLSEINSLFRYRKTNNEFENKSILNSLNEKVNNYNYELKNKIFKLENNLQDINKEINNTKDEIANLNKGIHKYPENVNKLIDLLKRDFKTTYNEEVDVKPLAEFLELKENSEEYRNAIEGYLNTQRFHLIIDTKHYQRAANIYNKYRKEVHSAKIIDGSKLKYNESIESTLAEHINVPHSEVAKNYVNSILNKVMIVDDVNDLRKHKTAITKECMLYKNNGISKINPEIYKYPFIGRNAIQIKLNNLEETLNQLNIKYDTDYNNLENNNKLQNSIENIQILKLHNINLTGSFYLYNKAVEEYELKEREYNTLTKDNNYLLLTEQIENLENKMDKDEESIRKLGIEVGVKEGDNKNIALETNQLNKELSYYQEEYNLISKVDISNLDNKYFNIKITRKIQDEINKTLNDKNIELNKTKNSLESKLSKYIQTYFVHYTPEVGHISHFLNEFDELERTRINIQAEIVDLESKSKEILIKRFLNDVEEEIYKVNELIKKVNANLRTKTFGSDSYEIKINKTDTKELNFIYEAAVNRNLTPSLENYDVIDENINKIREIIGDYLEGSNNKEVETLLDVRNYFEFDVTVKSSNYRKSLMQMLDKQSGGESQVPFYILIAAAFEETMEKRKSEDEKLCIVLFDEAFSNMDGQRVEEMLKFFNELNIQVIISVPGKYDSIVPYVDTTLIVTRENETGEIHDINHLRKRYS